MSGWIAAYPLESKLTVFTSYGRIRNIEVTVREQKESVGKTFQVSEALLRRASKAVAAELDLAAIKDSLSLTIEDVSPAAFAEVIVFLTGGEPFNDEWMTKVCWPFHIDELAIDVCNMAYKWDMKELFNLALEAFSTVFNVWEGDAECKCAVSYHPSCISFASICRDGSSLHYTRQRLFHLRLGNIRG